MQFKSRVMQAFFICVFFVGGGTGIAAADDSDLERRVRTLEERMKPQDDDFRVYFKNGLRFDSHDKNFKYQIGGRIQTDFAFYDADNTFKANFNEPGNGAEFRRARFFVSGLLYNRVQFKAEYDFAGQTSFNDVYLGLIRLPLVGNLNLGHFKEPFSLEELTSSKYLTFMERSVANAFSPGRNIGVAIYDEGFDSRITWAAGVFRPTGTKPPLIQSDDGYNLTFRVTGVPLYEEKGAQLVHLGFGYSFSAPSGPTFQFSSKPESNLTPTAYVDTGTFSAEGANRFSFEAAVVFHAFSIQSEYFLVMVDRPSGLSSANFKGGYIEASYFLTGEHRNYKKGEFGRVTPNKNFFEAGGWGAWQIAARVSTIDLNDGAITGGQENNVTVGLNWHLNALTRFMVNYGHADVNGAGGVNFGGLDFYQLRFQVEF